MRTFRVTRQVSKDGVTWGTVFEVTVRDDEFYIPSQEQLEQEKRLIVEGYTLFRSQLSEV